MLPEKILPNKFHIRFGQNQAINSGDISDIKFTWVVGWGVKPNIGLGYVRLGLGFANTIIVFTIFLQVTAALQNRSVLNNKIFTQTLPGITYLTIEWSNLKETFSDGQIGVKLV